MRHIRILLPQNTTGEDAEHVCLRWEYNIIAKLVNYSHVVFFVQQTIYKFKG